MCRLSGEHISGLEKDEALGSGLIGECACELLSVRGQIEIEEVGGIGKRVEHPYGLEVPSMRTMVERPLSCLTPHSVPSLRLNTRSPTLRL